MKNITDYLFDSYDKQLLTHLKIEFGYHEQDYFRAPQGFTFESIGLFPGCKEIINYFVDNIQTNVSNPSDDKWVIKSSNIKNGLFFKDLILTFETRGDSTINAEYESETGIDWNEKEQVFNYIKVNYSAAKDDRASCLRRSL